MRPLLATTLLAVLVLAAACVEQESVVTQDIVSSIPWPDEERAEYVLLDRGSGEERGRGVLSVTRKGDQFELQLRFESDGNSDESVTLVDATSLKPISTRRERRGNETEIVEAEYDRIEEIVRVTEIIDGEERPVPRRLDKEHYFDNDSSLFLWRTIRFEEGYKASYHSVLTNQGGAQQLVTIEIMGMEEITVPAGVFQTWRLEIRSPGVSQIVWYADTPEHTLVQYDNSIQIFQLTELRGG